MLLTAFSFVRLTPLPKKKNCFKLRTDNNTSLLINSGLFFNDGLIAYFLRFILSISTTSGSTLWLSNSNSVSSSLNAAIRVSLTTFNDRRLSGRKESRRELFEETEKDFLQPLPAMRYQMKSRKTATVMQNSFVVLNKHNYSVPKEYIGKRVDLIYDAENINIYYGLKLVTIHQRDDTPYTYTQKEAHGLPGHHGSYEKDLEEICQRAGEIDNILLLYLKNVAEQAKYPPKAFRSCRGIMSLEKKYGLDRLVAACACATEGRLYGYNEVKEILERGDDAAFLSSDEENTEETYEPQKHKNIRGREYYSQKPQSTNITSNKNNGNNK